MTDSSGYLWKGIKVFLEEILHTVYIFVLFIAIVHTSNAPSFSLFVSVSIKHSTQTCTKALSSKNSLPVCVSQPVLVHLCVPACVLGACLNVCQPQLLEPIQGFRGDHTTQRDNQRQAHAAPREDINTGTAGQGAQEGRARQRGRK